MAILIEWVDPNKDHVMNILCQILYYCLLYSLKKENIPIVIMPTHPKPTQVPRVIQDLHDVLGRTQGSYPENCMSMSIID